MLAGCNCAWMQPIGSSSSSRNGAVRCPRRMRARSLFALASAPAGLARSLLGEVVESDARLVWTGAHVALAGAAAEDLPLEAATFVVVDLETTGLSARTSEICEIGAVRVRGLATAGTFETFVRPRAPLGAGDHAADRDPQRRPARSAGRRRRHAPLPRVRRRLRARRAQRPLRHVVPRPSRRPDGVTPAGCAGPRHGSARTGASERPRGHERASRRSRGSSGRRCSRATARSPTRRRRPRSSWP